MSAQGLGSRAIIGRFYATLEAELGSSWVDVVSMLFNSDQASEEYKWLGMTPALREWIGGRLAKGFRESGVTIRNKTYEGTLEVLVDEIRRDKTGQVMVRVDELAVRAAEHWAKLLSTLIENGASTACYDGQFFFDTDHDEGDSGTQDNDLSVNVTTPASPTAAEMEGAILDAMEAILGFKDDQGEPMNAAARSFLVMLPTNHLSAGMAATRSPIIETSAGGARTGLLTNMNGFNVQATVNPRLTATDKLYVFRADGQVKPFIRQEEEGITVSAIAEGSELEFKENKHQYGVKAIRNVGYGYWQHGCLVTLT